jgi:hypothetical protein
MWGERYPSKVGGLVQLIRSKILLHRTIALPYLKRSLAGFPPRRPGFDPKSGDMGFLVDKVALGQVFFDELGFPYQLSFHKILYTHLSSAPVQ